MHIPFLSDLRKETPAALRWKVAASDRDFISHQANASATRSFSANLSSAPFYAKMAARRQSSTTSLSRYARASSPSFQNKSLDFCNAFWGIGDVGVDVLFARMRGAARTMEELKNFWKERCADVLTLCYILRLLETSGHQSRTSTRSDWPNWRNRRWGEMR